MARRRKKRLNRKVLALVLLVCGLVVAFGVVLVIRKLPKDPITCAERSGTYLDEARKGIEAYEEFLSDPATEADQREAQLNEALGDYRRAYGHLTDAIKFSEKNREAHLAYRFDAVDMLEEWMRQPGQSKEWLEKLRDEWLNQLRAITTEDSRNVEAHSKLTDFYWAVANRQGSKEPSLWSRFLETAEPLSRLDPDNATLFCNMAAAHAALVVSDRAHHGELVTCYALAAAAEPRETRTYLLWANYLLKGAPTRERDDALVPAGELTIETVREYIAEVAETYKAEDDPPAQAQRALERLSPRDVYRLGIAANPASVSLRVALAEYEYFSGDPAAGEDEFRRAMAIETKTAEDVHTLAACCFRTGGAVTSDRADEALSLWETARQMDPTLLDAYASPVEVHLARGDYEQAADLCRAGLDVIEERLDGREIQDVEDVRTRQRFQRGTVQLNVGLARALVARMPAEAEPRAARVEEIRACLERAGAFLQRLEDGRSPSSFWLRLQLSEAKVRARLARVSGDLFAAEELYRLIYEQSPSLDLEASSELVRLYLAFEQENEATRILTQLTQTFPEEPRPWLMLGRIYFAQRNMDEVDRAIRQIESLDLDESQAQALAELKARARALKVQIGGGVPSGDMPDQVDRVDIPMWLSYAQRLWDDGETEEATDVLLSLKTRFPGEETVVVALVTMYLQENQAKMALTTLNEALEVNPDSERLTFLQRVVEAPAEKRHEVLVAFINEHQTGARRELSLARLYARRGEPGDEARYFEHMERAVELDPTMDGCLDRLFVVYLRADRLDAAARLADRAAELNLNGVEGRIHRARLLMAQEKWDEAVTLLSESLAIRGERFAEARALLGDCYLNIGRIDQAHDSFRASYELNHRDVRTLVGLARVAEIRNDGEAHRRWINEAYAHAPGIAYVRRHWLRYRQASEEPAQFIRDCRNLLRRYPGDMEIMTMLASAYEQASPPQYERAEELYRAVYERTRGTEASLRYLEKLTMFLQRIGKVDAAEALLNQTTAEQAADQAGLYLMKARFLTETRRYDEARAQIEKVLQAFPDDERGYRFLGQWALATGRDWGAGVDALAELMRRHPEDTALAEHYYEMLMRAGMNDRAIEELEARLADHPQDDATMALLAQAHYMQGRIDEAKAMCDRAISANGDQVRARVLRSDILFERGQREASLADLRHAFELRRSEPIALLLSARLSQIDPDGQRAKAVLRQALGERRESVPLLRRLAELYVKTRDWHGLDSVLARGREVQPRLAAWGILEASKWQATGQPDRAARALRSAYEMEPNNVDLMLAYLDALLDIGQYDRVIETIGEMSDREGQVAIHLRAMVGRSRVGLDQVDEGVADLSASLAAARTIPSIRLVAKHFFAAVGNDKGVELLRQWMARRPDPSFRIALVIKLVQLGRWTEADEVLAGIEASTCTTEQWVWVLRSLGEARYKQGDYAGAREAYEAALAKSPDDVYILNNLAYMLAESLNDPAGALPHARKAASLMPTDPNLADTLGWIYFQNGQVDQAERELRRSLQLSETPAALYHLGRVLESLGRVDEAAVEYKRGYDLVRGRPQDPFHDPLQKKAP
ncbi:MAG: tetratricopeptide repeat protein [Planctomycetota bacterium]